MCSSYGICTFNVSPARLKKRKKKLLATTSVTKDVWNMQSCTFGVKLRPEKKIGLALHKF